MHIKQILSQSRRDFWAIYRCEHCGCEHEGVGYDDTYFHTEVVPDMVCSSCGKTADESYEPRSPKYPEGVQL